MKRMPFGTWGPLLFTHLPFVFQNAVDKRIPPATFEPLVLPQLAFAAHPKLFHHMPRAGVLCNAPRPDPVQAELAEAEADDGMRRFCRVALSPLVRRELVADVAF